jgi:hypothetical protein
MEGEFKDGKLEGQGRYANQATTFDFFEQDLNGRCCASGLLLRFESAFDETSEGKWKHVSNLNAFSKYALCIRSNAGG